MLFPDVLSAPSSQESPKKQHQHEADPQSRGPAGSGDGKESETRSVVGAQLEQKKQLTTVKD